MKKETFHKKRYFKLIQIIYFSSLIFFSLSLIILGILGSDVEVAGFFWAGVLAIVYWLIKRVFYYLMFGEKIFGKNQKGAVIGFIIGMIIAFLWIFVMTIIYPEEDLAGIVIISFLVSGLIFGFIGYLIQNYMENKKTKQSVIFFLEFLKNIKSLGTPFQSSKSLANAVSSKVTGTKIVELGAGNGQITKSILANHPKVKIYAFETNKNLLKNLNNIKSERLIILNKDAKDFSKYTTNVDCIVSGIPLSSTSKEINNKILTNAKKSKRFIQYKYFPEKKLLKKYFNNVTMKIIWRNIPPAVVYVCDNNKIKG